MDTLNHHKQQTKILPPHITKTVTFESPFPSPQYPNDGDIIHCKITI